MLACKRGHETVVEVLVAKGAEIYMADYRARTARDTAIRRHHLKLLKHLNTQVCQPMCMFLDIACVAHLSLVQVQVQCASEQLRVERAALLRQMRDACNKNFLRFNPDVGVLDLLLSAMRRSRRGRGSALSLEGLKDIAEATAASFGAIHNADELPKGRMSRLIACGKAMDVCRSVMQSVSKHSTANPLPTSMDPRRRLYHDWQWPLLLMR